MPEWEHHPAPQIAIDYWGLEKDAKMLDVIRSLRADEANHRYINHTLAELKPSDFNPFAYGDPSPQLRGKTWGLTRDEAIAYFEHEDIKRRNGEGESTTNTSTPPKTDSSKHTSFEGRKGVPA